MNPLTSPIVVPPTAGYPYVDGLERLAAGRMSSRAVPRLAAPGGRRRPFTAVAALGEAVLAAYVVPFVILAIGMPIALLVRVGMWIVGAR